MHNDICETAAKQDVAVVIAADQQVDAVLAVLVTVPVVHPVIRHLQDPYFSDRDDLLPACRVSSLVVQSRLKGVAMKPKCGHYNVSSRILRCLW